MDNSSTAKGSKHAGKKLFQDFPVDWDFPVVCFGLGVITTLDAVISEACPKKCIL